MHIVQKLNRSAKNWWLSSLLHLRKELTRLFRPNMPTVSTHNIMNSDNNNIIMTNLDQIELPISITVNLLTQFNLWITCTTDYQLLYLFHSGRVPWLWVRLVCARMECEVEILHHFSAVLLLLSSSSSLPWKRHSWPLPLVTSSECKGCRRRWRLGWVLTVTPVLPDPSHHPPSLKNKKKN